jgi:hypothetical protein
MRRVHCDGSGPDRMLFWGIVAIHRLREADFIENIPIQSDFAFVRRESRINEDGNRRSIRVRLTQ